MNKNPFKMIGPWIVLVVYLLFSVVYSFDRIGFLCGDMACNYDGNVKVLDVLLMPSYVLSSTFAKIDNYYNPRIILDTGEDVTNRGIFYSLSRMVESYALILNGIIGFLLGWLIQILIRKVR